MLLLSTIRILTIDPKKMAFFSPESHTGRKKSLKPGANQKGGLFPGSSLSHSSDNLSDHLAGKHFYLHDCCFVFGLFDTRSPVAQAGLELARQLKLALNS